MLIKLLKKIALKACSVIILLLCFPFFKGNAQSKDRDSLVARIVEGASMKINIPYFVTSEDLDRLRGQVLHFDPDANLEKYPLFEYHVIMDRISPLKIGQNVPKEVLDLPIRIVNGKAGQDSVTLHELSKNKILVLDFWATWCAPCLASMHKWKELYPKYKDQVEVVGLMLDYDYKAERTIRKRDWSMPQLIGPEVYLLNAYFCGTPVTGPSAWIRDGVLIGITDATADVENILKRMVSGEISTIPDEDMWKSPF